MSKTALALLALIIGLGAGLYLSDTLQLTRHGLEYRAVQQFPDGAIYAGKLDEDGLASGDGTLEWPNGNRYRGAFARGMMNGRGTLTTAEGFRYQGDFVDGAGTGQAVIDYLDGSHYAGQVENSVQHGFGELTFTEGGSYRGQFRRGNIDGAGTWEQPGAWVYRGQLRAGRFHGRGEVRYDNGDRYIGEFRRGAYQGNGVFIAADHTRYEGDFVDDRFTGKGTITFSDGGRHVGEFEDWQPNGEGIYTDADGNQYRGVFSHGSLSGTGEFIGADGEHYKGGFEYGRYSGNGELWMPNGDYYKGEFRYGAKHGRGQLTRANPDAEVRTINGTWENNRLVAAEGNIAIHTPEQLAEQALYQQGDALQRAIAAVAEGDDARIDLFTLGIGAFGAEEVFNREINYIADDFAQRFGNKAHSIFLSNTRRHPGERPLATITSIEQSLNALAQKMNRDQDILFLYVTSHGSRNKTIAINQPGLKLPDLEATQLRKLLDKSGIKWRVIVLSACFSGGFIPDLQSDNTLVITAAAADRSSFGCADLNDFTYFGEAYFKESLPETGDFVEAFKRATTLISEWEQAEDKKPSNPQLVSGKAIADQLRAWRTQTASHLPDQKL